MKRQHYSGHNVERAVTIADLRRMAQRRVPAIAFEYMEGGSGREQTLHRNREDLDRLTFSRRALVDVSTRDLSSSFFGQRTGMPCAIGPTGFNGLQWRNADIHLANAAKRHEIPFTLSMVSSDSLRDVMQRAGGRIWFQMYIWRDESLTESMITDAESLGCEALIVTVDAPLLGNRVWDRRLYSKPMKPTLGAKLDALLHPRWFWSVYCKGLPSFGNLEQFLPQENTNALDGARLAGEKYRTNKRPIEIKFPD